MAKYKHLITHNKKTAFCHSVGTCLEEHEECQECQRGFAARKFLTTIALSLQCLVKALVILSSVTCEMPCSIRVSL